MKQYRVIYDAGEFIDGIECDSFEEAKNTALEIMENWHIDEIRNWKDPSHLTEEEIESHDALIENFCTWVEEYDEESEEYEEVWCPSDEDLLSIFWKPYKDLAADLAK